MAKFRYIHVEFWQDARVLEEMTPEDKYFYLYLLTNPSTTQIGVYQITKKQMAFDLGYSTESINSLLDRFIKVHGLIKYNDQTREIAILNWGKYNLNKAGKPILDCVKKELREVKDKSLLIDLLPNIPNQTIYELFSRYVHDTSTTSGEKEKEKEKEKESLGEIRNAADDAINFYQQNFGVLNPFITQSIIEWVNDLSEELVLEAMKRALAQQKKWKYADSILKDWYNQNVSNMSDVEALDMEFQNRKNMPKDSPPVSSVTNKPFEFDINAGEDWV
ncbi:DnaD domain protein [Heyndrickxia camelliae]|uniref:DNA replication protein DnaD n=1 Tax=Heyndrickxia camelliae TaxID=1707093 RepID=A0A2N3LJX9_9BACI|nr:DnaD domain protein [Heyndrickxia camelliae]PKR84887.1 DNA replication protein DnaD [Heyndrickxia camelliae]